MQCFRENHYTSQEYLYAPILSRCVPVFHRAHSKHVSNLKEKIYQYWKSSMRPKRNFPILKKNHHTDFQQVSRSFREQILFDYGRNHYQLQYKTRIYVPCQQQQNFKALILLTAEHVYYYFNYCNDNHNSYLLKRSSYSCSKLSNVQKSKNNYHVDNNCNISSISVWIDFTYQSVIKS